MNTPNFSSPIPPAAHYSKHIFVCVNKREQQAACGDFASQNARDYLKQQLKAKQLYGAGLMRVSNSGCLGRCALGPVLVIYPEAVWYTYLDNTDIDEIIARHLQQGQVVQRLLLDPRFEPRL